MLPTRLRPWIGIPATLLRLFWLKCTHEAQGWKYYISSNATVRSDGGRFHLSSGCWLDHFSKIHAVGGSITMGRRVFVNVSSQITAQVGITIGDDVLIADHCTIIDHDHDLGADVARPWGQRGYIAAPIVIGSGAWIGSHAVILKGVTIGEHAVVAAGAVVTKSIPAGEIWGGIPARKIGARPQFRTANDS